jgi:hypothetical protein
VFGFPEKVNETSARLVAAGVVTMAGTAVAFDQPALMVPLTYGFLARVLAGPRFSPLALLATRVLTPRLDTKHRLVPGPPKRLAQGVGLALSGSALVLHYGFGRTRAAYRLLALLLGAASLEAAFGICLACKAYPMLVKAGMVSPTSCPGCIDLGSRGGLQAPAGGEAAA